MMLHPGRVVEHQSASSCCAGRCALVRAHGLWNMRRYVLYCVLSQQFLQFLQFYNFTIFSHFLQFFYNFFTFFYNFSFFFFTIFLTIFSFFTKIYIYIYIYIFFCNFSFFYHFLQQYMPLRTLFVPLHSCPVVLC